MITQYLPLNPTSLTTSLENGKTNRIPHGRIQRPSPPTQINPPPRKPRRSPQLLQKRDHQRIPTDNQITKKGDRRPPEIPYPLGVDTKDHLSESQYAKDKEPEEVVEHGVGVVF